VIREGGFAPFRCVGCGTMEFDPEPGSEDNPSAVMSLRRFWVTSPDHQRGPGYAVCNACLNRRIGFLWGDDGTLSRVWYGDDN
jgi:hypothetical protein